MEEILELLYEKNELLTHFYNINRAFLKRMNFENALDIEGMYQNREKILVKIAGIDERLKMLSFSAEIDSLAGEDVQKEVANCLRRKDSIVKKILSQDLEILSFIDSIKSDMIKVFSETKADAAIKS